MRAIKNYITKRPFELKLTWLSLVSSLPLLILLLWVMVYVDISVWLVLLTAMISSIVIAYTNHRIHQNVVFKFRSLSNLLDAMSHGEYTLRTPQDHSYNELEELTASINALASRLTKQRWQSAESQILLRKVIDYINVAIIAISDEKTLSLTNPAARRLLHIHEPGSDKNIINQLLFVRDIPVGSQRVVELSFGFRQGRYNVHVDDFRESGVHHKLLFITDVSQILRDEETKAWQNLVRVINHEINNSLTPIISISQTLSQLTPQAGASDEIRRDLTEGLKIIRRRSGGLIQFVDSYKKLAQTPVPIKQNIDIRELLEKVALLFNDQVTIVIEKQGRPHLDADPVLLEQVLINLIKNSIEAMSAEALEGDIRVNWHKDEYFFRLTISDQGEGIANTENLFTPFYSTKKNGSGIGLVLCRQILEAHNGRIGIKNRRDCRGCITTIELPLGPD